MVLRWMFCIECILMHFCFCRTGPWTQCLAHIQSINAIYIFSSIKQLWLTLLLRVLNWTNQKRLFFQSLECLTQQFFPVLIHFFSLPFWVPICACLYHHTVNYQGCRWEEDSMQEMCSSWACKHVKQARRFTNETKASQPEPGGNLNVWFIIVKIGL